VGVGQSVENIGDSSYRGMSSVELAALSGTVAGIRQFEISGRTPAPLGKSNNYSRTVAQRIGADPRARSSSRSAGRGRSIWSPSSRARSPPAAAAW
jgi:acetyl-CoA C-acetyltransferase